MNRKPWTRKLVFAALYLSEGAPIGYLWLALPTRLRDHGVALDKITWLTAVLVLPWTFKFLGAPWMDALRSPAWPFRYWIYTAQSLMALTLVPLWWIDPVAQFHWMAIVLIAHAICAALQDVAIDGLCITSTHPSERGELNGWMQCGMMVGRAAMGGGALVLGTYIGESAVIGVLIGLTSFSMVLLWRFPIAEFAEGDAPLESSGRGARWRSFWQAVQQALRLRNTWLGLGFALLGGAAFKSFEVIYGPFLVDRGYSREAIGWFSAGPMILLMIAGALCGGRLADRRHRLAIVAWSLVAVAVLIFLFATADAMANGQPGWHLWIGLVLIAFAIGMLTASSYALFMDLTTPRIAAAQFSAFMGATNGCESWSTFAIGKIIVASSYPVGMATMAAVSLLTLLILVGIRLPRSSTGYVEEP